MIALHFAAMYILMYAMVNVFSNVYNNFNQFYMAGLMTASMVVLELFLMPAMYQNKKVNAMILSFSGIALIAFWIFIRQQTAISDKQFLKSMIPHHASAILMCEEARIRNSQIQDLCRRIISGQQLEIQQMKTKLNEMEK